MIRTFDVEEIDDFGSKVYKLMSGACHNQPIAQLQSHTRLFVLCYAIQRLFAPCLQQAEVLQYWLQVFEREVYNHTSNFGSFRFADILLYKFIQQSACFSPIVRVFCNHSRQQQIGLSQVFLLTLTLLFRLCYAIHRLFAQCLQQAVVLQYWLQVFEREVYNHTSNFGSFRFADILLYKFIQQSACFSPIVRVFCNHSRQHHMRLSQVFLLVCH